MTVNELHTVGKPCGSGQSVWELASSIPLASYIPWASCVAVGKLYAAGELCVAAGKLGIRRGVGADVTVAHRTRALVLA
jgi:hypothetical protein